jgi:hypothetical protein
MGPEDKKPMAKTIKLFTIVIQMEGDKSIVFVTADFIAEKCLTAKNTSS